MPKEKKNKIAQLSDDIFDDIPAGICRFRIDEHLTITNANERFYELFGYAKSQAIQEGFNSVLYLLSEREQKRVYQYLRLLAEGRIPEKGEIEIKVQHPSGKTVVVLVRYHFRGEGTDWITINVIDITDRKRMEDELRISEKRYKLALSQSGKVFFFFDAKTKSIQLSDELAQQFGLPNVVDNMPDNPLMLELMEPGSKEAYQDFYRRILRGDESGDTIISCHIRSKPEEVLWYKTVFTSIFDAKHSPVSTIITYEEYTEKYRAHIEEKWQQANINSAENGDFYLSVEYDLTRGIRQRAIGEMAWMLTDGGSGYDMVFLPVDYGMVIEEDGPSYRHFLNRKRLLHLFENGITEECFECRMKQQRQGEPKWVRITVRMIQDPYTNHVLSQLLFKNIHAEKSKELLIEQNMQELQRKLEASRVKAMINQMQPHFLYNALSAIRTIIRRDPEKAYHLLYDFTIHLRSSIKALSSDNPIPFSDELKNIRAYLNIEMMRFEQTLHVKYEIDCENFKIVPLSIQPLTENAARHGIYNKGTEGGTVTIRSYEASDAYIIEVEDDGCGFDVKDALKEDNNSYGLKNLIFRLETLMHATVDIQSELGKGTLVRVVLPKGGGPVDENNSSR